ncbi:unnamed protein product [Lymnaea stagnalis]|uniref:EMI domain-containing protein n=1 Tax=Lymnaea stagnalis TaxID=6523 RepID=A0AAV2IAH4_LYMST
MVLMGLRSFLFTLLLFIISTTLSRAMWCTRLKRVTHVESYVVLAQCSHAYKAKCGWFTSKECTYYELVECPVEQNRTVEKYMIIEECCQGYELDPINNITCIKKHDNISAEVTTVDSVIESGLSFRGHEEITTVDSVIESGLLFKGHAEGVHYYDAASDSTLLELSHGAYAGIICTAIFVLCVSVLIIIHILKRNRNTKLKQDVVKVEMDVTEKMIPAQT